MECPVLKMHMYENAYEVEEASVKDALWVQLQDI